jgi:hypothetical protein
MVASPPPEPEPEFYRYTPPKIPRERQPKLHGKVLSYPPAVLLEANRILTASGHAAFEAFLASHRGECHEVSRSTTSSTGATLCAAEIFRENHMLEQVRRSKEQIQSLKRRLDSRAEQIMRLEDAIQKVRDENKVDEDRKAKLELFVEQYSQMEKLCTEVDEIIPGPVAQKPQAKPVAAVKPLAVAKPVAEPSTQRKPTLVLRGRLRMHGLKQYLPTVAHQLLAAGKHTFTTDDALAQFRKQPGFAAARKASVYALLVDEGKRDKPLVVKQPERGMFGLTRSVSAAQHRKHG